MRSNFIINTVSLTVKKYSTAIGGMTAKRKLFLVIDSKSIVWEFKTDSSLFTIVQEWIELWLIQNYIVSSYQRAKNLMRVWKKQSIASSNQTYFSIGSVQYNVLKIPNVMNIEINDTPVWLCRVHCTVFEKFIRHYFAAQGSTWHRSAKRKCTIFCWTMFRTAEQLNQRLNYIDDMRPSYGLNFMSVWCSVVQLQICPKCIRFERWNDGTILPSTI